MALHTRIIIIVIIIMIIITINIICICDVCSHFRWINMIANRRRDTTTRRLYVIGAVTI